MAKKWLSIKYIKTNVFCKSLIYNGGETQNRTPNQLTSDQEVGGSRPSRRAMTIKYLLIYFCLTAIYNTFRHEFELF